MTWSNNCTNLLLFCVPGSRFLCSVLVAPVKNENNEIILFILNLEDITDAPVKTENYRSSLKNSKYCEYNNHRPTGHPSKSVNISEYVCLECNDLTLRALTYFYINQETKGFFSFWNDYKWSSLLFPLYLNTMLWVYRHYEYFTISVWDLL